MLRQVIISVCAFFFFQVQSFGYNHALRSQGNIIIPNKYVPPVRLGIDILEMRNFDALIGKNVGLLTTSYTTDSNGNSTIEVLRNAKGFKLISVFDPHTGFFTKNATNLDQKISTLINLSDDVSLPRKSIITPEFLKLIDILVIDLQDTGLRFCQNIFSMMHAMSECFQRDIEILILDRPNPLGNLTGGPCVEQKTISIAGPINGMPLLHGLTIGEVANYVNNVGINILVSSNDRTEKYRVNIKPKKKLTKKRKLTIIPVDGWSHATLWQDIHIRWTAPSNKLHNIECINDFAINSLAFLCSAFAKNSPLWDFHHLKDNNRYFACISGSEINIVDTFEKLEKNYFSIMTGVQLSLIVDNNQQCLLFDAKNFFQLVPCGINLFLISEAQKSLKPWMNLSEYHKKLLLRTIGDTELCEYLFSGKEIDVYYFLDKWEKQAKQFNDSMSIHLLY